MKPKFKINYLLATILICTNPVAGETKSFPTESNQTTTYTQGNKPVWISSSNSIQWKSSEIALVDSLNTIPDIVITARPAQVVDGFGVCFNELGWTALSVLDESKKQEILKDLFDPDNGLRLNICRMPVGANDYALNFYSLNDSAGDFEMKHFTIERDKKYLIPYIKSAMKYRPDLEIWGSPWCPPAWMKTNNHYACYPDVVNDLKPEQTGKEGSTQFRMSPEYLKAYALYFMKYVQAYKEEGIRISAIHPQNEMNSCQNFPSCLWTATDLSHFIGKYLGPTLKEAFPDVRIWYGTYERPLVEKIDTVLSDPETSTYVSGVSFQWSGKHAIPGVHKKYPNLKLMQSETECGDGSNDWKAAEYTFSLMKHYFDNGISIYTFWNSILNETGKSMWGWKQNSLITIDSKTAEVKYNPEYYLLKHFSSCVDPGAWLLEAEGKTENTLVFRNPDGTIVIISGNTSDAPEKLSFDVHGKAFTAEIPAHTFNTFVIPLKD